MTTPESNVWVTLSGKDLLDRMDDFGSHLADLKTDLHTFIAKWETLPGTVADLDIRVRTLEVVPERVSALEGRVAAQETARGKIEPKLWWLAGFVACLSGGGVVFQIVSR